MKLWVLLAGREVTRPVHYIMLKEVVNLASAAAELADPCFDAGKGYKRFYALTGFFNFFSTLYILR